VTPLGDVPSDDHAPGRAHEAPPGAVRLGRLGRTHGLAGALRCHPLGPLELEALLASERLFVEGHGTLVVRLRRPHGDVALLAFQGIRSPERAQPLVNAYAYALPGSLPAPLAQALARRIDAAALAGAEVLVDGHPYGRVTDVREGAQRLLVVAGPFGERYLPADAPYVELEEGLVRVVDAPAGLLDEG
jgi:ribosomal 30S subunit maturation factor RimM